MLRALTLSLGDLGDAAILRVLAASLALTLGVFVALAAGLGWALDGRDPCAAIGIGACRFGAGTSGVAGVVAAALAGWLLFPAVAIGVVSLFADRIVAAVERRHYPAAAAQARAAGWGETLAMGLGSAGRVLLLNLLALPLYLILLVTGVGTVVLFLAVNGVALGRDLGDMAAVRHLDRAARRDWRARTKATRFALGVAAGALFLVPVVNLLAPVLGAAMATHLFHGRRR